MKRKISLSVLALVVMLTTLFSSVSFAATVGQRLGAPETGWQRIDVTDDKFEYLDSSKWATDSAIGGSWGGSLKVASAGGQVRFIFKGTKLRLITYNSSVRTTNNTISIDGVTYTFTEHRETLMSQILSFEKTNLTDGLHEVIITAGNSPAGAVATLDAIDIDSTGYMINPHIDIPNLTATTGTEKIDLNWSAVSGATSYNVKRATTAGGPYEVSVTEATYSTYSDSNVVTGATYYYVVTAVNANGEGAPSNEASATFAPTNPILDVVIEKEKVKIGEEFTSDIILKNVSNIYAEDFKINYDSTLLNYVGFEEVPGYKIYNQPTDENGTLRFIVASQGEQYGINGEQVFLKLKFSGKAKGIAKVDALECRIADTESEYDLEGSSCSEDSIEVEGFKDVNRSGEYTLVDLAIDAFYYGMLAANTDHSKHEADQAGDESINDADLLFIVSEMLNNTNYPLNA